jgi:adenosine deaminase
MVDVQAQIEKYTQSTVIPKIELHAHLFGSITLKTIQKIAPQLATAIGGTTLKACFDSFKIIEQLVTSKEILCEVADDVIKEFRNHNVVYFELRTTPKVLLDGTNKVQYMQALVDLIESYPYEWPIIRLIISINREKGIEEAKSTWEAVKLVAQNTKLIVGIDFCGNPAKGSFKPFMSLFEEIRSAGYKITLHIAEVEAMDDIDDMINFKPDRLAHGCYLKERVKLVIDSHIPMEICPSSNYATLGLTSYSKIPNISVYLKEKHCFAICTDNTILFQTNISQELYEVMHAFNLSIEDMKEIQLRAVDCIFDSTVKDKVKLEINKYKV